MKRVGLMLLTGIVLGSLQLTAGEVSDLFRQHKMGSERPCLDCCVCPNDYCRKPQPWTPKVCLPCCPDYCRKPEPIVPKLCLPCCPDYCRKPPPAIPFLTCRPGLKCVPDCPCPKCEPPCETAKKPLLPLPGLGTTLR